VAREHGGVFEATATPWLVVSSQQHWFLAF